MTRTSVLVRDSDTIWRDDAIDFFIDGNNSKGRIYDGIDDRQLIIPLLINGDNDGDDCDAKWGWHHPSRTFVDVGNTFRYPSFTGTAVIN